MCSLTCHLETMSHLSLPRMHRRRVYFQGILQQALLIISTSSSDNVSAALGMQYMLEGLHFVVQNLLV